MKIENRKLDSGILLQSVTTNKFKMSRLSLSFITEADVRLSPMRKLMLSTIFRGSEKYPTVAHINRALDELYGSNVSFRYYPDGDKHVFTFVCEMLDERYMLENDKKDILRGTLDILKDIFKNPIKNENGLLKQEYIDSEKQIMCDSIKAKMNEQRSYSQDRCKAIMFKGLPSGISIEGNQDIISSFSNEELTNCHENFFSDCNVRCFYLGNKSGDEIAKLLSDIFGDCIKSKDIAGNYTPYVGRHEIFYENEKKQVSQCRLNLGLSASYVLGDKDYYAVSLFNEIFGGSSISKLFMNVREKKSLAYYCSSVYMASKGVIFISCGINNENHDHAYDEIVYQLSEMKKGNFTDDDIISAKRLLLNSYKQINDSPAALDSYYFRRGMAGIKLTPDESREIIMSLTKEDIINAARNVNIDTVYYLYSDNEDVEEECYE